MGLERLTPLDSFVDSKAPICYGILKPGPHHADGVPVIKVKNIVDGKILEGALLRTTEEIHRQYKRSEVRAGDLLLTIRGSVGRLAIVPDSLTGANITQDTARIRVSSDDDPLYVFYALHSARASRQMELNTVGQAVKGINIAEVRKIELYHPELRHQRKIAEILSTWDRAIEVVDKLIKNSERQKQALMQRLLTKKERLSHCQDDWRNVTLGDICSRVTDRNEELNDTVLTISAQQGLVRQESFFKKRVASDTLEGYFLISKGQFAYNKSYSNGYPMGAIKRLHDFEKGVVTTLYICFEVSDESACDPGFLEHYFNQGLLNRGLTRIANEGGRAHGLLNVKPEDFFDLQLLIPPIAEQRAIDRVLSSAHQEVEELKAQHALLLDERTALMQQLLTGKRRVKVDSDVDRIVSEVAAHG